MSGIEVVATPVNIDQNAQNQLQQDKSIHKELEFLKDSSGVKDLNK